MASGCSPTTAMSISGRLSSTRCSTSSTGGTRWCSCIPRLRCAAETRWLGYPRPGIEFIFDTTRAVVNLIYSGTLDRCPQISWIIPHGGGALPRSAPASTRSGRWRPTGAAPTNRSPPTSVGFTTTWRDLGPTRPFAALLGIADESRLLYGSDWPFTPEVGVARMLADLVRTTAARGRPDRGLTEPERSPAPSTFGRLSVQGRFRGPRRAARGCVLRWMGPPGRNQPATFRTSGCESWACARCNASATSARV